LQAQTEASTAPVLAQTEANPPASVSDEDNADDDDDDADDADDDADEDDDDDDNDDEDQGQTRSRAQSGSASIMRRHPQTATVPSRPRQVHIAPNPVEDNEDDQGRIRAQRPARHGSGNALARPILRRSLQASDIESGLRQGTSGETPSARHSRHSPSRVTDTWELEAYSAVIPVTYKRKCSKQKQRGSLKTCNVGDILHDLLAASFVPLTDHLTDPDKIQDQATTFLSSFSNNDGLILFLASVPSLILL